MAIQTEAQSSSELTWKDLSVATDCKIVAILNIVLFYEAIAVDCRHIVEDVV